MLGLPTVFRWHWSPGATFPSPPQAVLGPPLFSPHSHLTDHRVCEFVVAPLHLSSCRTNSSVPRAVLEHSTYGLAASFR